MISSSKLLLPSKNRKSSRPRTPPAQILWAEQERLLIVSVTEHLDYGLWVLFRDALQDDNIESHAANFKQKQSQNASRWPLVSLPCRIHA